MKQVHLILIIILSAFHFAMAGSDVEGIVKDKSNGKILAYATVTVGDGQYGVISDETGAFRLEIKDADEGDSIIISYVGYKTLRLTAQEILENKICLLEPYVFSIEEVIITPIDAEDILRKAYDDFYKNHVHKDMATYGYYREQIFDRDRCVRYGEAVFATRFFEKDGKDMAALEPFKARSIDDSTFLKRLNDLFNSRRMLIPVGMDAYIDNDMVSGFKVDQYYDFVGEFFFGESRNGFNVDYQLRENYIQNGRESYFVSFNVHKKRVHVATGQILIDQETYGIAAFEIQFREQENLTRIILPPKIRLILKVLGYGVNIGDYEAKLYNRYEDGKWFIGRGIQIISGGIAKRRDWINGKIINEFHAYYSKGYQEPEAQIDFNDIRVNDFSTSFWDGYQYSPIQPAQQQYIQAILHRNSSFSGEVLSRKVRAKLAAKELKEQE